MSDSWIDTTPDCPGWYRASVNRDYAARRYWNGVEWSAPVYEGDPIEHFINAKNTPAHVEPGYVILHLDDPEVDESVSRQIAEFLRADPFVATQASAPDLLDAAAGHIRARASTYDKPQGERSMERTVQAFNAITGHDVSESQGWLFMELLKAVRDYTTEGGHADSQEDRIAYAALAAEARRAGR